MKLLLFDVDGTLTKPRLVITQDMLDTLIKLKNNKDVHIGFVGGSDLNKQIEQIGIENFYLFDWRFSENGLSAFKNKEQIFQGSFSSFFGETHFKKLINLSLQVLSYTDCPIKRGTFIEFRNGMINISPIGRSCSQEEREQFYEFDKLHKIRENVISQIQTLWNDYIENLENKQNLKLTFSIGGQISIDIFPNGWNKTFCLQFVQNKYDEIHFFGDKTSPGGNDYEIFIDKRVIGHHVDSYTDTINILEQINE